MGADTTIFPFFSGWDIEVQRTKSLPRIAQLGHGEARCNLTPTLSTTQPHHLSRDLTLINVSFLPLPTPPAPTDPAELRHSSLSSAQLMVPGPLLCPRVPELGAFPAAAPVKMSTHILVLVNPLIKLLGRRKSWEQHRSGSLGDGTWSLGTPLAMSHWESKLWTGEDGRKPQALVALLRPVFREAASLWWFSCSPTAASPAALGCVCLGRSARGTLLGSVCATGGDAPTSWGSAPCSGSYSHFVQLLPAVRRHVYGQLGHRDSSPWQQLLTKPTNGLWSGPGSWVNRTFFLQQQKPFVWFPSSPYLDRRWCSNRSPTQESSTVWSTELLS